MAREAVPAAKADSVIVRMVDAKDVRVVPAVAGAVVGAVKAAVSNIRHCLILEEAVPRDRLFACQTRVNEKKVPRCAHTTHHLYGVVHCSYLGNTGRGI